MARLDKETHQFLLTGLSRWLFSILFTLAGACAVWVATLLVPEDASEGLTVSLYVASFVFGFWGARRLVLAGLSRLSGGD
jgi:hypothetical protein